jgi:hypothetical protein
MITESILNIFMFIPRIIIGLLPTIPAKIPENVFSTVDNLLYGIGYVLPMTALAPIFIISFAIDGFRVIMAIIVRIKSFIPTLGT